jgi:hypothetical protein
MAYDNAHGRRRHRADTGSVNDRVAFRVAQDEEFEASHFRLPHRRCGSLIDRPRDRTDILYVPQFATVAPVI